MPWYSHTLIIALLYGWVVAIFSKINFKNFKIVELITLVIQRQACILNAMEHCTDSLIMLDLVLSFPLIKMSSILQITPSRPSRMPDIVLWNISGGKLIPNGNLLKQNLPNGVINVVKSFDCSPSETCQYPLFASSLLKTLPCPSFERLSYTDGAGCTSRLTSFLSCVRSTQIRTLPFAFGTQTIPEHHSVGTVTGEKTFCLSIDSISALTFGNMGWGTFLGLYRQTGSASSLIVIW